MPDRNLLLMQPCNEFNTDYNIVSTFEGSISFSRSANQQRFQRFPLRHFLVRFQPNEGVCLRERKQRVRFLWTDQGEGIAVQLSPQIVWTLARVPQRMGRYYFRSHARFPAPTLKTKQRRSNKNYESHVSGNWITW